jgi:uncharacterized membrane-anchored protein
MLTISIPAEIEQQLSAITNDKTEFIIAAIKQKIALGKNNLSAHQLAEEYVDSIKENEKIKEDFANADNENWNDY